MPLRHFFLVFFAALWLPLSAAKADELSERLDAISKFAKANCEEVNQSGDVTTEKFKGSVEAGVSGLFKKFANVGGNGEAEVDTKKYTGIIQEELKQSLNDVRSCKQHIIDLLVPRLMKDSDNAVDMIVRTLKAGNNPTPPSACAGGISPESLIILLGGDYYVAERFPHTVLEVRGRQLVGLSRHEDGTLGLNMEVIGIDGRDIVKITDNRFEVNIDNYYSIVQEDPSKLTVISRDKADVLNVDFINPQTVRVTALLRYGRDLINITQDQIIINRTVALSGNCVFGSRVDLAIR